MFFFSKFFFSFTAVIAHKLFSNLLSFQTNQCGDIVQVLAHPVAAHQQFVVHGYGTTKRLQSKYFEQRSIAFDNFCTDVSLTTSIPFGKKNYANSKFSGKILEKQNSQTKIPVSGSSLKLLTFIQIESFTIYVHIDN